MGRCVAFVALSVCMLSAGTTSAHPNYDRATTSIRDASGGVHVLRTECGDGLFFVDPCWPALDDASFGKDVHCRNVVHAMTSASTGWAFCTDFVTAPGAMPTWAIADGSLVRSASPWPSWRMWLLGPATWPRSFLFAGLYATIATLVRGGWRRLRAARVAVALLGLPLLIVDAMYDDVPAWVLLQGVVCGVGVASIAAARADPSAVRRIWLTRTPVRLVTFVVACLAMGWLAEVEGIWAFVGLLAAFAVLVVALS
jgi:hypothetical protein